MQKNNLKSFICSFVFSILAVYGVQKAFLRAPETQKQQPAEQPMKPQKISLFAESDMPRLENDSVAIATKSQPVDTSDIAVLSVPQPVISEPVNEPVITAEKTDIVKPVAPSVSTELADASEIILSEDDKKQLAQTQHLENVGVVYADISDTLKAASAASEADEQIPVSQDVVTMHGQINVPGNAAASQIAMIEPRVLINSIEEPDILDEEKTLAEANIKNNELGEIFGEAAQPQDIDETAWKQASVANEQTPLIENEAELSEQDENSPWVLARGNKYAKNQTINESFTNTSETKSSESAEELNSGTDGIQNAVAPEDQTVVRQAFNEPLLKKTTDRKLAYQMIQNILIPIPDDILNDADLTPDLTDSPDASSKAEENAEKAAHRKAQKSPELQEKDKQSGLFKSIASWFGKNKTDDAKNTKNAGSSIKESATNALNTVKDKVYSALGSFDDYKKAGNEQIMPAELRLSFQPNRAEISGQTLKWIYAFADNARDNDNVYIEVRIDGTSSYALQQKRLNLLSSIFASRGVDYRKINIVFTSREPNSFIIRNIRFTRDNKGETNK